MEVENKYMMNSIVTSKYYSTREEDHHEEEDVALPGFRFHPTDEELVGFYLRRKVEKRPINIELIKQIDIYKYEPWDLPKSSNMGEKEWYFFCKRGRKYRNSIRPNRVTGCGFWKATGIDRPIYNSTARHECIGLKKSLVYYRGSAGKGTKTDWMMHEFRLPAENEKSTRHIEAKSIAQEAEVWTLCRILKRNGSYKKCLQAEWRVAAAAKRNQVMETSTSQTCSTGSSSDNCIISFGAPPPILNHNNRSSVIPQMGSEESRVYTNLTSTFSKVETTVKHNKNNITHETKPYISSHHNHVHQEMISNNNNQQLLLSSSSSVHNQTPSSSFGLQDMNEELLKNGDYWDELTSVLDLAIDPFF